MKYLLFHPLARRLVLFGVYGFGSLFSLWLSYQLRFDFLVPPEALIQYRFFIWIILLKICLLYAFRQFDGLLSYFSIPDITRLFYALGGTSLLLIVAWFVSAGEYAPPRGIILADFLLSFLGLSATRLAFRLFRERHWRKENQSRADVKRVGIIGAGDVGAALARELLSKRRLGLLPSVFFDDDSNKWNLRVHDIPVVGRPEILLNRGLTLPLEEIIIAMPSAPARRIGEIVKILQASRLPFQTVPSIDQLATGQVKVSQLRSVEIQDLLGRDAVSLETDSIRDILNRQIVIVTGAGGSIGAELCRQIVSFAPSRLLLLDQSEVQLFLIEQELSDKGFGGIILPLVADILDLERMRYIFDRFKPQVIFHAAAHKHVPMMEIQPGEAIKNNAFGTARLAELALQFGAERFILISTDKAINPTNVMGASKRLAEVFIQAIYAASPKQTKFITVRFGNVLGSSGSVIPTFNKQIAAGGPVKVTHPKVTRYFMTIPEAAGLVLQSAAQGEGGEIFVLDMGEPIKIVDLARQLIELSGLKADEDIEIEFVGLRPGEKLFEELSYQGENITKTNHPKIMRFVCNSQPISNVRALLDELSRDINQAEPAHLKLLLKKAVPEYQPYLT